MKTLTVYLVGNIIYLSDSNVLYSEDFPPDTVQVWEKSEFLFNDLKKYQDKGYTIIFK